MSKNRFKAYSGKNGRVVIDRKTGAWYMIRNGQIEDYGQMRNADCLIHLSELRHELSFAGIGD